MLLHVQYLALSGTLSPRTVGVQSCAILSGTPAHSSMRSMHVCQERALNRHFRASTPPPTHSKAKKYCVVL
jgi:hypothetical protein